MYHRWFEFKKSKYVIDYPLCSIENICVFIVYKINEHWKVEEVVEANYLFHSGARGVCISNKKKLRIHGVDNKNNYLDFGNWGDLKSPVSQGVWIVIAVWWNGTGSSLWINGGIDRRGKEVLVFEGNKAGGSCKTVIANSTEGNPGDALNGCIKNIEIYNKNISKDFMEARMKYLTLQYGIEDSVYK